MFSKIASWFKEECPYCKQGLIPQEFSHYTGKSCPNGHFTVETYPVLETQIEFHNQTQTIHYTRTI